MLLAHDKRPFMSAPDAAQTLVNHWFLLQHKLLYICVSYRILISSISDLWY